jgi:prolyl oligopeptidase
VLRDRRQGAFDDFQAVADLVERGVTSPRMVGAYGGSNGGILVGRSFVQRPDLSGAVWANNGVLELQRCSQLSGMPPVGERADGQNPDDWAYKRHSSPYHNVVVDEPYPAAPFHGQSGRRHRAPVSLAEVHRTAGRPRSRGCPLLRDDGGRARQGVQ